MLETRRRLQVTEKAGRRGWRQARYERCRIAWEGKKKKPMLLVWPSPSEPYQRGDHPVTGEKKILIKKRHKVQMYKELKMCNNVFLVLYSEHTPSL